MFEFNEIEIKGNAVMVHLSGTGTDDDALLLAQFEIGEGYEFREVQHDGTWNSAVVIFDRN